MIINVLPNSELSIPLTDSVKGMISHYLKSVVRSAVPITKAGKSPSNVFFAIPNSEFLILHHYFARRHFSSSRHYPRVTEMRGSHSSTVSQLNTVIVATRWQRCTITDRISRVPEVSLRSAFNQEYPTADTTFAVCASNVGQI